MPENFDKIAALENSAKGRDLAASSPSDVANAPRGPAFLEEADRRRAELVAGGGTIQDIVDAVMAAPGDLKSWTDALVQGAKGNMEPDEARGRIRTSIGWYSRKKKLIQEGERQKLVDA